MRAVGALVAASLVLAACGSTPDRMSEKRPATAPARTQASKGRPRPAPIFYGELGTRPKAPLPALTVRVGGPARARPYVIGHMLRTPAGDVSLPARPTSIDACLGDRAVLAPNGRRALVVTSTERPRHNDIRHQHPVLREVDIRSGATRVVADRACAPAWGADGRVAYVQGDRPFTDEARYRGRIVVRRGPGGAPHTWTDVRPWSRLRWAGRRLISVRAPQGSIAQRIVVISGPGRLRTIASAQDRRYLVAVDPTGTLALLGEQRQRHAGVDRLAVLVRLSDGRVLDRVSIASSGLDALDFDGDWTGHTIFAANGYSIGGPSHPDPRLAVLTEARGRLALRGVYRLVRRGEEIRNMGGGRAYEIHVQSPGIIAFELNAFGPVQRVTCRLRIRSCTMRASVGESIENPSRPRRLTAGRPATRLRP